jgi:hypothetical protein
MNLQVWINVQEALKPIGLWWIIGVSTFLLIAALLEVFFQRKQH